MTTLSGVTAREEADYLSAAAYRLAARAKSRFYVGVDLGQRQDHTAIAVVERSDFPGVPDPSVVEDGDVPVVHLDLEEAGRSKAGGISEQRGSGVEAKLVRQGFGDEGPGGVDVPATVDVRAEFAEPVGDLEIIDHPLAIQFGRMTMRRGDRVMAGDDQATRGSREIGQHRPGPGNLVRREEASGRDVRASRVEAEDRGEWVEIAEPGVVPGWGEGAEELLVVDGCRARH